MGLAAVSGRQAPHLQRRSGIYHLRLRVPDELRRRIGLAEVKRSLHTYAIDEARLLAAIYVPRVKRVLQMVDAENLSREETRSLILNCFKDLRSSVDQGYGPLRLRVYDRAARQRQLALPALYGPAPVTRVETSIRWKTGRPHLSGLFEVSNRLDGVRVAYASAIQSKSAEAWHDFCLKALAQGAANTYLPVGLITFLKLYEKCAGDLVNQTNWSEWDRGLEITGLAAWIATAKKGTAEPSCN